MIHCNTAVQKVLGFPTSTGDNYKACYGIAARGVGTAPTQGTALPGPWRRWHEESVPKTWPPSQQTLQVRNPN